MSSNRNFFYWRVNRELIHSKSLFTEFISIPECPLLYNYGRIIIIASFNNYNSVKVGENFRIYIMVLQAVSNPTSFISRAIKNIIYIYLFLYRN